MDEQRIGELLLKIQQEYDEMPGLSLTAAQAQRLWSLDAAACAGLFDVLLDAGVLCRNERNCYVRQDRGRAVAGPQKRLQKLPARASAVVEFRRIAALEPARSA